MRGINIHVKSQKAHIADIMISLLFSNRCKINESMIKKIPHFTF